MTESPTPRDPAVNEIDREAQLAALDQAIVEVEFNSTQLSDEAVYKSRELDAARASATSLAQELQDVAEQRDKVQGALTELRTQRAALAAELGL